MFLSKLVYNLMLLCTRTTLPTNRQCSLASSIVCICDLLYWGTATATKSFNHKVCAVSHVLKHLRHLRYGHALARCEVQYGMCYRDTTNLESVSSLNRTSRERFQVFSKRIQLHHKDVTHIFVHASCCPRMSQDGQIDLPGEILPFPPAKGCLRFHLGTV